MFSGIIEDKAIVNKVAKIPAGARISIRSKKIARGTKIGDSVSVNGTCLTAVDAGSETLQFDVMKETLRATTLSGFGTGDIVNVERALKAGDRISGHFVTGHIDCAGVINSVKKAPDDYAIEIEVPEENAVYLANRGSIAVDGVSLTIAGTRRNIFKVFIIPLTLAATSLGSKKTGDKVNIEFDILAKYALRTSRHGTSKIDEGFLKKYGFA